MSLILDALKRSEKQRRETEQSPTGLVMVQGEHKHRKGWMLWILIAVLVLNILALVLLYLKPPGYSLQGTPAASNPQQPVITRAVVSPPSKTTTQTPMKTIARSPTTMQASEALSSVLSSPLPQPSSLSSQAPTSTPPAIEKNKAAEGPESLDMFTATPEKLSEVDDSIRDDLSTLELNTVVYSDKAGKSFALINMQKYRAGDTLPGGDYKVDRIHPDGVVINYGASTVLLKASQ